MTTGVQIVWWIGLVGALLITLVILREVEMVLRSLHDIHRLAEFTRDAAQGIEKNVEVVPGLADVAGPAGQILAGSRRLKEISQAIAEKLAGPSRPSQ